MLAKLRKKRLPYTSKYQGPDTNAVGLGAWCANPRQSCEPEERVGGVGSDDVAMRGRKGSGGSALVCGERW